MRRVTQRSGFEKQGSLGGVRVVRKLATFGSKGRANTGPVSPHGNSQTRPDSGTDRHGGGEVAGILQDAHCRGGLSKLCRRLGFTDRKMNYVLMIHLIRPGWIGAGFFGGPRVRVPEGPSRGSGRGRDFNGIS